MHSGEKTILFIMPRLPFPASSGRKTSLFHYCRILSEKLGYRLVVAAFLERDDDVNLKPDFIDRLIILPKAMNREKIWNIFFDSIILRKKPLQVSLFWSKKAKERIDRLVEEEEPEVVIADMVRTTEYIKDINLRKIADLDDRISLRYKRQFEMDIEGINPYGAFITNVPAIVQKVLMLRTVKKFVLKNEIVLLERYEKAISTICDSTIFVAQSEADNLNREIGESKAISIPIGVDTKYFSCRGNIAKDNYIGFLGAMNVAHNESAIINFIENIFPSILKIRKDIKLLVIGGGVSERLLQYANANVVFTGKVDDVRDYLEKCKVFICPMTFGSGIKTKNLEAMSMGIPVVTTKIGAENIDARSDVEWLVKDNPKDFAEAILQLIENEKMRLEIGEKGCMFVNRKFTWDNAEDCFRNLLN